MHREARIANYVLAAFAIVSLTLLSLPLTGPVQSFKACLTYVLNPVAYYGDKGVQRFANVPPHVRDLVSADIENKLMHEEIKKTAWVQAEADALKLENQRLRSELGLRAASAREPLWAHVMQREPINWYRSFMVDAGSEQGVTLNAPVLGQKGESVVAIGRVYEVRPKSSIVLLVNDERSSVAAYVASPSTDTVKDYEGLLQGQGSSRLRMNYLEPDVKVDTGDLVYTSPTSATFPPAVLIGSVDKVFSQDPFLTFQSVEVKPALDASTLDEVMILKTQTAAQPLPAPAVSKQPAAESGDDEDDGAAGTP